MRFYVVTIFPEVLEALDFSILKLARERGLLEIIPVNPRDFATDRHRTVDDEPYGGGAGMVMKPEPLVAAVEEVKARDPEAKSYLLSPRGRTFTQVVAQEMARESAVTLICGRYEGVDERVRAYVDGEVSMGDFVLAGGELAAMVIIETVARLVPGVLGSRESLEEESFAGNLLEYPQYTRPPIFGGLEVPQVLRSGNHQEIARWRRYQQIKVTWERRPDLLARAELSPQDREYLAMVVKGEDLWEDL
ncbi:MAG: tRNA (guanosine(37)-N1)-methyltransferase TrmD [Aquificota bacterium]|nr:MAG: tRNA (guanosine(37)-N1)-methyltransferase TrmD [Aquificota bacterium]